MNVCYAVCTRPRRRVADTPRKARMLSDMGCRVAAMNHQTPSPSSSSASLPLVPLLSSSGARLSCSDSSPPRLARAACTAAFAGAGKDTLQVERLERRQRTAEPAAGSAAGVGDLGAFEVERHELRQPPVVGGGGAPAPAAAPRGGEALVVERVIIKTENLLLLPPQGRREATAPGDRCRVRRMRVWSRPPGALSQGGGEGRGARVAHVQQQARADGRQRVRAQPRRRLPPPGAGWLAEAQHLERCSPAPSVPSNFISSAEAFTEPADHLRLRSSSQS